jgi:uncharacterized protein (DUF433 family)
MKKRAALLDRIEVNPGILSGKPVIKGTRIPVYLILELLSAGYGYSKIRSSYPSLKDLDIRAAIEYAAAMMKNEEMAELGT